MSRSVVHAFAAWAIAACLLCVLSERTRAQPQVLPQPACDFLTKADAERILGGPVDNRSQGLDCWFVQTGWTNKPPNNKAIRFGLAYYPSPRPDDFVDTRKNSRDYLPPGGVLEETDFSDAALWLWIPNFGGTLTAFKGGMIQASVNITGLPEDVALREAKALASKPLGGGASTGYAYRGWSKPDTRTASTSGAAPGTATAPAAGTSPAAAAAPSSATPAPARTQSAARPEISGTFADAPYLTGAEFLRDVKQVSLRLNANPELKKWLPLEELQADVVAALEDHGIDVRASSPFELSVRMKLEEHGFDRGDEVHQSTDDVLVSFDFYTRVAVRRHGAFHVLNAAVVRSDAIATVFENNSVRKAVFGDERRADLREQLPKSLDDLLTSMEGHKTVDTSPWYPAKWSDAQKAEANAALFAAMKEPSPPGKRFDDIDSMPVYNFALPAEDDSCKGRRREWGDAWKIGFAERGWEKPASAVESPLYLDHSFWCDYVSTVNVPTYYRIMNTMELKEANAVFAFNGRIVRKVVTLAAWSNVAATADNLDAVMDATTELIDAALEDIDVELD